MPNRRVKRKEYSRPDLLDAKNPAQNETPAVSECRASGGRSHHLFDGTTKRHGESYFAIPDYPSNAAVGEGRPHSRIIARPSRTW